MGEENAAFFAAHYDVSAGGNFEGHNILNRLKDLPRSMEDRGRTRHAALLCCSKEREGRVRPGLDDKVLADWNGLMIAALVNAGIILDEPGWLGMAQQAFDFIAKNMTRGDRLGHSWRAGKLLFPGLASDFAAMIRAALALYEATGERGYLERALDLAARVRRALRRPRHRRLLSVRRRCRRPAAAAAFHRGRRHAQPERGRRAKPGAAGACSPATTPGAQQADRLIEGILSAAERNLFGHVALLNALDLRLRAAEIVATGPDAEPLRASRAETAVPRPHRAARRRRRRPARRRTRRRRSSRPPRAARPSSASASAVRCR